MGSVAGGIFAFWVLLHVGGRAQEEVANPAPEQGAQEDVTELPPAPGEAPLTGELFDDAAPPPQPWGDDGLGEGDPLAVAEGSGADRAPVEEVDLWNETWGGNPMTSGSGGGMGAGGGLGTDSFRRLTFRATANLGLSLQSTTGNSGGQSDDDGLQADAGLGFSLMNDLGGAPGFNYDINYRVGATANEGMWSDLRFSHALDAGIAHQGVHTLSTLRTSYSYSDADTGGGEEFDREIRLSENTRWSVNGSITRNLARGSLSLSAGTSTTESGDSSGSSDESTTAAAADPAAGNPGEEFFPGADVSGSGLNDSTSRYVDLAWFFMPPGAAKSSVGLGVNLGTSETENSPDQSWWEPSLRWQYPKSERVNIDAQVGYNIRSFEGSSDDSTAWTYNAEIGWVPVDGTSFSLSVYREVASSLITFAENTVDSGVAFTAAKQIAGRYNLAANVRYENSEFLAVGTSPGESDNREDRFFSFGVSLSRAFELERMTMTASVFYDVNDTDSDEESGDFSRRVGGVRFGFAR